MKLNTVAITQLMGTQTPLNLLDKIVSKTPGESLIALKNVSANESYFQGHFPGNPVMPGVLIIESMIEAVKVLTRSQKQDLVLQKINHARFRQMVRPGDKLLIKVKQKDSTIFEARAFLKDELACNADLYFTTDN